MHASDMANESCLWCAIAAIGYYMKPFSGSLEVAHVVLGSIALGLGFLQILAILGRPAPVCCIFHRVLNSAAGSHCWRASDGAGLLDAMTSMWRITCWPLRCSLPLMRRLLPECRTTSTASTGRSTTQMSGGCSLPS